jgi:hypothetical protein
VLVAPEPVVLPVLPVLPAVLPAPV